MPVTLRRMLHEIAAPSGGMPGYRWAIRYVVVREDGTEEYPPCTRKEAFARARELGAIPPIAMTDDAKSFMVDTEKE